MIRKQKLKFENKWDKTLSEQDRIAIETFFNHMSPSDTDTDEEGLFFHTFRVARNYKEDLLVTVLTENRTGNQYSVHDDELLYVEGEHIVTRKHFTMPQLNIPPYTTMPWTFIFPMDATISVPIQYNGIILKELK